MKSGNDRPVDSIAAAASHLDRCLLCGRPPAVVDVFVPNEPWNFVHAPPRAGATRLLVLGLCLRCFERPGLESRVEAELLRRSS